jgi:hypothetical protein
VHTDLDEQPVEADEMNIGDNIVNDNNVVDGPTEMPLQLRKRIRH